MKTVHAFRRLPTEAFVVDFQGQSLPFKADAQGQVVSAMPDDVADALIAAAPCGYRELGASPTVAPKTPAKKAEPKIEALYGSDKYGPHLQIGGEQVQLGTVVAAAHTASGLSVEDWNALAAADRDALIDQQIAAMTPESTDTGSSGAVASPFVITSPEDVKIDLGPMTDDEVREFAVKQGLPKPHHTKKGDKLKLAVIEALKAQ